MDHAIGEVISAVKDDGTFEETLIIITSDHGENLGQHYDTFWGHNSLHETVTHIPLIMRYPKKLPKDARIKGFGQQVDLLPTILDLVAMETDVL